MPNFRHLLVAVPVLAAAACGDNIDALRPADAPVPDAPAADAPKSDGAVDAPIDAAADSGAPIDANTDSAPPNDATGDAVLAKHTFIVRCVSPSCGTDYTIDDMQDPTLTLTRGSIYVFNIEVGDSHPFELRTQKRGEAGGQQYTDGVVGDQPMSKGELIFTVPLNAPDTLFYQCKNHDDMLGQIDITSR